FFSVQGAPDSLHVMSELDGWIGRHTFETSDGNFLLCGEGSNGNGLDAFVMKFSPSGSPLWLWSAGAPNTDYATSVTEGSGRNYFSGGKRYPSSSTSNQ